MAYPLHALVAFNAARRALGHTFVLRRSATEAIVRSTSRLQVLPHAYLSGLQNVFGGSLGAFSMQQRETLLPTVPPTGGLRAMNRSGTMALVFTAMPLSFDVEWLRPLGEPPSAGRMVLSWLTERPLPFPKSLPREGYWERVVALAMTAELTQGEIIAASGRPATVVVAAWDSVLRQGRSPQHPDPSGGDYHRAYKTVMG